LVSFLVYFYLLPVLGGDWVILGPGGLAAGGDSARFRGTSNNNLETGSFSMLGDS
jgi:hypothetical protein